MLPASYVFTFFCSSLIKCWNDKLIVVILQVAQQSSKQKLKRTELKKQISGTKQEALLCHMDDESLLLRHFINMQ